MERKNALRNLIEDDLTASVSEKSSEIIDIFRPQRGSVLQRMIDEDALVEDVISFLNQAEFTMTFGLGLKRLVIQKFNLDKDTEQDVLVEKLYSAFIVRDIRVLEENAANANEDMPERERNKIREWFNNLFVNRHLFLSKISFALELDVIETTRFLTKTIGEQGYNHRDMEELVIFFCHYKKMPRNIYLELFSELSKTNPKATAESQETARDYSTYFDENYESIFKNEEAFRCFVLKNKQNFTRIRESATKEFLRLYDSLQKQIIGTSKQEFLHNDIRVRNSLLNPLTAQKPLNAVRLSNIRNGHENVTKKDIVTLCFYILCVKRDLFLQGKGADTQIDYHREAHDFICKTNNILNELGFFELYEANRFDNLILISLYHPFPRELYDDVIYADKSDNNDEWTYDIQRNIERMNQREVDEQSARQNG